ncbi:cytidine deaminase [Helicovermis profundi]|uniref:Cytidine deaminase n=1 Tax=Helicovermis profundi TaxID=3065157 RepID=A0AAU9EJ98_9FIRM|nr:cytidine deaminase [Clostridia bacterium S502]
MDYKELVRKAYEVRDNAYAPYSKYKVGAALLTKNGKIYLGCNVECGSFGGTNCAERTALFSAIADGEKEFTAIAIVSSSNDFTYPCGICRQVLIEFGKDLDVVIAKDMEYKVLKLGELLPHSWTSEELL